MKIACVYTVETYNSIELPLSAATEIPFGISIILTVLQEAGHDVSLLVITPDTPYDEYVGDYIRNEGPSLFCFTAVSTQYWQAVRVAEYVNSVDESIFCILGGHHSSLNSDEVIGEGKFDAICVGEGEKSIVALANTLEKKQGDSTLIGNSESIYNIPHLWFRNRVSGEVQRNPTGEFREDLDSLPLINRQVWDRWTESPGDYPAILLGRGCPFKCTYCSNHAMAKLSSGTYVRFRSQAHIVSELEYIKRVYPEVSRVYLEVETFGANRKASYAVFDALADYNSTLDVPIEYGVNMALTSNYMVNPERRIELFEKAQNANIRTINIGLESGSERMRKLLIRPRYTNKQIIEFCKAANQYDIRIIFFVLLGLPGETIEDYMETVRVARAAQPHRCYVSIFYPYLGTDLANTAIEMGLIDKDNLSPRSERSNTEISLPGFSRRRIRFEYIVFCWRVYKGYWGYTKIIANVVQSFLKAHPKAYSSYLHLRNSWSFLLILADRYNRDDGVLLQRKIVKTVGTREDVIRD